MWVNRRARCVGQAGTPVLGRVLAVCVLRVGATTTGTRLRLVYLVTLVDTRHRDGRTARYVPLVRPMWTVTHRLCVRCVRRVTMLVQDRRFALHVLRVSTMTTMRRARRALGAMWAITLLRHRWCALHAGVAIMTTTQIRLHRATTRRPSVLRVITRMRRRIGVICALLGWRISMETRPRRV